MKISKEDIVITIAMVSLALNVYLGVKLYSGETDVYSTRLKSQNDSLIRAYANHEEILGDKDRRKADSLVALVKTYQKADSLNKIKYTYEKNKVKSYTPARRNAMYDSIYGGTK